MRGRLAVSLTTAAVVGMLGACLVPAPAAANHHWARHVAKAKRYARGRAGVVSFAVRDERGRYHVMHGCRHFDSASVIKVMLMVAYLNAPDVRDRRLRDADRDLLRPMITWSDNPTANRVYEKVGNEGLNRVAQRSGMTRFTPNSVWGLSQITARDQARFMYRVGRYVPARHRGYALYLLRSIVASQRWGIPPVRPPGWRIHFKGGFVPDGSTGRWKINQVALLRNPPRRRMSIAILTRGNPTEGYGHETVRGVARRLFRHYNRDTR